MQQTIDIDKFKQVAHQMFWRGAALEQIDEFEKVVTALASRLRVMAEVTGSHRSKYLAVVDRARNYSWREWTDEEMSDPRILRVRDKRPAPDRAHDPASH